MTQWEFINPHAFLTLEVTETGGASQRWRVELDDQGELSEIGMTARTLRSGDRVMVLGSPAPARRTVCTSMAPPTATALNRWAAGRGCDPRPAVARRETVSPLG